MFRNLALILPALAIAIYLYDRNRPDRMAEPDAPALELVAGKSRAQSNFSGTLDGEAAEAYRDWTNTPAHFGAFATSDFGSYGWVSKYHDEVHARASALAFCGLPDCEVIAISRPLTSAGPGELVVSERTMQFFFDYLQSPGAKAFAIAPNGATGWNQGSRSLNNARKSALEECQKRRLDGNLPLDLEQPGCTIVHSSIN